MNATRLSIFCVSVAIVLCLFAADQKPQTVQEQQPTASGQRETIARPLSEKQKKKRDEKLRKELESPYRKWLNEDVAYIITDEERAAFKRLQTDEEREQFIEQFWLRRDPTPDTVENEFKEEHYRRIAYANEHFASGIPGWKTDRGRIYITYGPPDEIDDHSSGGSYDRPQEEGGGETSTFPFIDWRYRYIEGIGNNIVIEFVDPTMSGEFRITTDPEEKDALLYVPGAGLTDLEQMGLADKSQRFTNTDGTHMNPADESNEPESMNEFNRIDQYAKLMQPPKIKFTDLEAQISSKISYNILPMKVLVDYFPITDATVMTQITLQFDNKDLQFQSKQGVQKAVVNIYGRISTLTRRIVTPFEDTVSVDSPTQMLQDIAQRKSIYQKTIPLAPGTYRLNVVAKDVVAGNINNYEVALVVPRLDPDKLSASSLVLADMIEKVPLRSIGGQFVIGDSKVRPRVDSIFHRDEKMGIYMKLYNLGSGAGTFKPSGDVQYELLKTGSNEKIFEFTENFDQIPDASSQQVTIEKLLPLKTLAPGQYTIRLKITDTTRKQVLTPSAQFTVT